MLLRHARGLRMSPSVALRRASRAPRQLGVRAISTSQAESATELHINGLEELDGLAPLPADAPPCFFIAAGNDRET